MLLGPPGSACPPPTAEAMGLELECRLSPVPLAFSCGHSFAPAMIACSRASRMRETADCRLRLEASARAIRLCSSGSLIRVHHFATSASLGDCVLRAGNSLNVAGAAVCGGL